LTLPDGTIVLSSGDTTRALNRFLNHEWVHVLAQSDPESYAQLMAALPLELVESARQRYAQLAEAQGINARADQEEGVAVVAETVADLLADPGKLAELRSIVRPSVWQRIKAAIAAVLRRFRQQANDQGADPATARMLLRATEAFQKAIAAAEARGGRGYTPAARKRARAALRGRDRSDPQNFEFLESEQTGTRDFGRMPRGVPGMEPGPIRLQIGWQDPENPHHGWGDAHIEANAADGRLDGYDSAIDMVGDVTQNFTEIRDQGDGRWVLVKKNGRQKIAIIELRKAQDGYYAVVTAFQLDAGRPIRGQKVWERSAPASSGSGSTGPTSATPATGVTSSTQGDGVKRSGVQTPDTIDQPPPQGKRNPPEGADIRESARSANEASSRMLKRVGIRGIKYLDGSSRGRAEGSHNYVIFDDADVNIVGRYALRPVDAKADLTLNRMAAITRVLQEFDHGKRPVYVSRERREYHISRASLLKMTAHLGRSGSPKPYQRERIAAIQSLSELVGRAEPTADYADRMAQPDVARIREFTAPFRFDGQIWTVRLLAKDFTVDAKTSNRTLRDKLHSLAIVDVEVEKPAGSGAVGGEGISLDSIGIDQTTALDRPESPSAGPSRPIIEQPPPQGKQNPPDQPPRQAIRDPAQSEPDDPAASGRLRRRVRGTQEIDASERPAGPSHQVRNLSTSPAPWASSPAQTQQGRTLLRLIRRDPQGRKAGPRQIVDYFNERLGTIMLVGRTQTGRRHPAHYKLLYRIIRSRAGGWSLNFHEGGHAASAILDDRLPGWRGGACSAFESALSVGFVGCVEFAVSRWVRGGFGLG
jgi:hypothetical protein